MTQILLDIEELAGASSELRGAAGEYQAIGARVVSCDCGCMPPDVASTVDAAAAAIRSRLDSLAAGVAGEGADLAWRAGIPQDAGGTAMSAASGPGVQAGGGTTVTIGGDPYGLFSQPSSGGYTLTIGGDPNGWFSEPSVGASTITLGGDPYGWFSQPATGGSTITLGGDPYGLFAQQATGGYTLTIPGTPLWQPGEQEAIEAAVERTMPLWHFFPRGVGVPIFNPMPLLNPFAVQDAFGTFGNMGSAWTNPDGVFSHYDTTRHEVVYTTYP